MREAIIDEVADLTEHRTFETIHMSEFPDDANAHTARFVPAITSDANSLTKYKARYVKGGQRDITKNYLIQRAQML